MWLEAFYQLDNRRSEVPVGVEFADLLEQLIALAEDEPRDQGGAEDRAAKTCQKPSKTIGIIG